VPDAPTHETLVKAAASSDTDTDTDTDTASVADTSEEHQP
jgi:hypothetical protein